MSSPLVKLIVKYGNDLIITTQDLTGKSGIYNKPPTLILQNSDPNKVYLVTMTDPDAVCWTHYIVTIKNKKQTIQVPYVGPAPLAGTGTHHYVFNVYEIKEDDLRQLQRATTIHRDMYFQAILLQKSLGNTAYFTVQTATETATAAKSYFNPFANITA